MFSQGLSLDQAPPISVVLRFFLTVPLFGLLLASVMIVHPHELMITTHPYSLSAVHLLFLGVITMSMIGSLFQMQSVLGGSPIPSPGFHAPLIHALLALGSLSLAGAFYFYLPILFTMAGILLGSAILYTISLVLPLLFKGSPNDTLKGMRLALASLLLTAILGLSMIYGFSDDKIGMLHPLLKNLHYSTGLIGWVGALIIAVAFQVIEMFYVTTAYGAWCKRNLFWFIALSLLLKALLLFYTPAYVWMVEIALALLLFGFVYTTLQRLYTRKRRVSDVSIWFWTLGVILLGISLGAYSIYLLSQDSIVLHVSFIAFALFSLAIVLGMMNKIIPFLVWFHLNAQGYMETPLMSNVIPSKRTKVLFVLFAWTALFAFGAIVSPVSLTISGIGAVGVFTILGYNLVYAAMLYRNIKRNGTRFDMGMS